MKATPVSERGQVLVLIALAIVGLIGITGLAIDGSNILADRRHAQNTADTAALAAALAKLHAQAPIPDGLGMTNVEARAPMKTAGLDRAISNGYYPDLLSSQVEVYACDEAGASCPAPYTGKNSYVQVIITSNVDTFFARVLGISQLHNRVQSIALADDDDSGPLFNAAAIYTTNPDCPDNGSLILNGGAGTTINIIGGSMASNSNDWCAVKCNLNDTATLNLPGGITTAGGDFNWGGKCTETSFPHSTDATQIDYPDDIPVLPVPPECDGSDPAYWGKQTFGTYYDPASAADVTASFITPGYYNGFPPTRLDGVNVKNTIVLAPGVYCVDSVLKQTSNPVHVYGKDVTIYVRAGNNITVNGGVVQLTATNGSHAPYPPYGTSNQAYKNYLFIAEPDYYGPVTSCVFDGNADNIYVGAIFAPHCNITINGSGDTPPDGIISQIIGFNVKINGSTNLNINYQSDFSPVEADPPKTGLTR